MQSSAASLVALLVCSAALVAGCVEPHSTTESGGGVVEREPADPPVQPSPYSRDRLVDSGPIDVAWPESNDTYVADSLLMVTQLETPQMDYQPCCRDFTAWADDVIEACYDPMQSNKESCDEVLDEAAPDNRYAEVEHDLSTFFDESRATSDTPLIPGTDDRVRLIDVRGDVDGERRVVAALLHGRLVAGASAGEAVAGEPVLEILPASFVGETGTPNTSLNPVALDGEGGFVAEGIALPVRIWAGPASLDVVLEDAVIRGTIQSDGDGGIASASGTLDGYIRVESIVRALNDVVADEDECGCLGPRPEPFFELEPESKRPVAVGECTDVDLDRCHREDRCPVMTSTLRYSLWGGEETVLPLCALLPGIYSGDLDLDGDCLRGDGTCTYEAMSYGMRWQAVSVSLAE